MHSYPDLKLSAFPFLQRQSFIPTARLWLQCAICLFVSSPIQAATNYTRLKSFDSFAQGGPEAELIEGRGGRLYGTVRGDNVFPNGAVFAITKNGSGYMVLHDFSNSGNESYPTRSLVESRNGFLYGVTQRGGPANVGVVFKMQTNGSGYVVLPTSLSGIVGVLFEGTDGKFYGTTRRGGPHDSGVVFTMKFDGTEYTIIHAFSGRFTMDGAEPHGLIEGRDGKLYGVTVMGGTAGFGTIFKLHKDGSGYQIVHHCTLNSDDCISPYASLLETEDGGLYGTSWLGGAGRGGTVFRLNKDGSSFRVLRHFANDSAEGARPYSKLVIAMDGRLYGTTYAGGISSGGAIFVLNTDGSGYRVLHAFDLAAGDGVNPTAGLVEGSDGALYGTTLYGGALNIGTIFRVVPPAYAKFLQPEKDRENIHMTVRGAPGRSVSVHRSADLLTWSNFVSGFFADGEFSFSDVVETSSRRFYRATVEP